MSVTKISERYGQSLLELAQESNSLDRVVSDMKVFVETLENRDLVNLLNSPIVKGDQKIKIFEGIFGAHLSDLTKRYFNLIIKKGRESLLPSIAESFVQQYKKLQKISTVTLKVASDISESQLNEIKSKLAKSESTDENIELEVIVDPNLIGGFVLELEGTQYDESIRSKIAQLKKNFSSKN